MSTIRLINPFKCQTWENHDRLGDDVCVSSCMSLIQSMQKHGQKQPVLARYANSPGDYEYELIYGARRLFAARHLGIELLVDVRDIDDRTALLEMDIENRVRQDITPYERGLSYQRWLRKSFFRNQVELARCLGVSEAQVSRLLRFAELPAVVVGAFKSPGDIREGWAVLLAKRNSDPSGRKQLIQRARRCTQSTRSRSPQSIYDALMNDEKKVVGSRSREDVVKSRQGRPILRVAFRAKAVHFILPRQRMTQPLVTRITEQIRDLLDGCRSSEASASSSSRDNERTTNDELN